MSYEQALDEIERFLGRDELSRTERKRVPRKRGDDPANLGRLEYVEFSLATDEDMADLERDARLLVRSRVSDATLAKELLDVLGLLDDE